METKLSVETITVQPEKGRIAYGISLTIEKENGFKHTTQYAQIVATDDIAQMRIQGKNEPINLELKNLYTDYVENRKTIEISSLPL